MGLGGLNNSVIKNMTLGFRQSRIQVLLSLLGGIV